MTVTVTTDRTTFRRAIIAWVAAGTGIDASKIIWGDQTAPRPAKPYATILFPSLTMPGLSDDTEQTFNASTQAVERRSSGPRLITAQIDVYSDPATSANSAEAAELMTNTVDLLQTVSVRDSFRAAKIGVISQTAVQRMDEQLGERWERRAMAEVTFSYSAETFDDGGAGTGGWIDTVAVPSEKTGTADYGTDDHDEYEGLGP